MILGRHYGDFQHKLRAASRVPSQPPTRSHPSKGSWYTPCYHPNSGIFRRDSRRRRWWQRRRFRPCDWRNNVASTALVVTQFNLLDLDRTCSIFARARYELPLIPSSLLFFTFLSSCSTQSLLSQPISNFLEPVSIGITLFFTMLFFHLPYFPSMLLFLLSGQLSMPNFSISVAKKRI